MTDITSTQIEEVYRLFDGEGEGIRIKEIGTVMRSLGLNPTTQLLEEFVKDARSRTDEFGPATINLPQFTEYCERAKAGNALAETSASSDLEGLKDGMAHFYQKTFPSRCALDKVDHVSLKKFMHLLSHLGDPLTEEESEELLKAIKTNCTIKNDQVEFKELKRMVFLGK